MNKVQALILVSFLTCFPITSHAQGPAALQLGSPIEHKLGPGQVHEFTVTAEENNFIQLVVAQRGIDVIVRVFSPAGTSLGEFDSPNGSDGDENVSFVAVTAGKYRISVAPLDPTATNEGRYQIRILELRKATDEELKTSRNKEVVKTKGLALLTELEGLIQQIKSPQTRIRMQMDAAQLLWETDEKRASKYISDTITGFNELVETADTADQQYFQQYQMISQLRQDVVQVLAAHDPDAALNFLNSAALPPTPSGNRQEQLWQDSALELSIASQFIQKEDPNRALQIARRTLKKGFSPNLNTVLSELRFKKPELATELANEIASKLLNEKLLENAEAASFALNLIGLFQARVQIVNQDPRVSPPPLLPDDKYRELFQKIVTEALSYSPSSSQSNGIGREPAWMMLNGLQSSGIDLDKMVTGGAAAVQKKLAELSGPAIQQGAVSQDYQLTIADSPADTVLETIEKAPPDVQEQLYMQFANREAMNGDSERARQIINDHVTNLYQRQQALMNLKQQEVYRAINKGQVEDALRAISAIRNPRERAAQLLQVANQIGPGHKRSSAINLLEQARSLLSSSPQAQDEEQMRALFEIARAFSRYDSKRAFEIIDPLIDQVNELCAAARMLDGFGSQNYEDGELNLQNGNGVSNVARDMAAVLGSLALTNFDAAKAGADRIRLPEVRIRTYLQIAQQTIQGAK